MKVFRFLSIAAMALAMGACSNNDFGIDQQPAVANGKGIPFTATISMDNSSTRALTEDGTNITATWAENEKVALIHNDVVDKVTVASVTGGVATITGSITGSPTNGDVVTVVYPYSAVDATSKDVKADVLAAQNGTLTGTNSIAENYDVRKGTGTLKVDGTATLNGNVSLTNQNAIFKLTLRDIDDAADVSATSVIISDQSGTVTTVTPASGYDKVMYVALPTTATTLKFLVTGSDSKKYFNMASGLSLSTKYYQSTIKLATVGDVILSTGKCAKAGTSGAVAMIAYLGDGDDNTTYNSGLAIALADESSSFCAWAGTSESAGVSTSTTMTAHKAYLNGIADTQTLITKYGDGYAASKAAAYSVAGFTPGDCGCSGWFLPSSGQWLKFFEAAGVNVAGWTDWDWAPGGTADWTKVNYLMNTAASGSSVKADWYWSSSEHDDGYAVYVGFYSGGVYLTYENKGNAYCYVRSFLAF